MKRLSAFLAAAALVLMVMPTVCAAQYSGYYYYPYYYAPPPQPPPQPRAQPGTLYYHLTPDPQLYWKWGVNNRIWDFQQLNRSPLNPESDLEYMLRTF